MEKLKQRQQEILDFIKSFIAEKGYAPTVREIANGSGYSSTSNVHSHLTTLKDRGFIRWVPDTPRTIKVLNKPNGDGADE